MTNNNLFFLCSLIEFIGRQQKLARNEVVSLLGQEAVKHIYGFADVLHSEPISKVADEYIDLRQVGTGNFDNVAACKYTVPSYWDIGKVYARLIQDVSGDISDKGKIIGTLKEVYGSWISDSLSNFNTDFFYQPHDYIRECYFEGKIL
ncbi:MAG: hypothetical protein IJ587_01185 [Synergistaceae bacterium]|nr:hypothetical protein [Synergistaceae bacterium]